MGIFSGKTLLMLGSNVESANIVKYAKENGAYTITADYLSPEKSEAKTVSDENYLISTADMEALSCLVERKKVDGIIAGISEFNLLQAMALCEKYDLPFYCNREQWDMIENKEQFRELCELCHVPCPQTFFCGKKIQSAVLEKIKYPVVIKPVDASSSAGVHICVNEEELRKAEDDARSNSACGRIIVEQFIEGTEFTAHYTINNYVPTLSSVDNRYPAAVHEGNVTTVPVARVYPCHFLNEYLESVHNSMICLCNKLGIQDGVLFIQGLYSEKTGFSIFEGGLRSAGEAPNRFLSRINGVNYMKMLVEHALLGHSVTFDSSKENPFLNNKCCGIISFVTKGGRVGEIRGLENAVKSTRSVIEYECRYPIGTDTPYGNTLRQLMIRFVMICDSREQMAEDVAYLNKNIDVFDENGKEMVIKFEPSRLFDVL